MGKQRKQHSRKKQEKQISEFRKERTKEAQGHSRYCFKKRGKTLFGLRITHGNRYKGISGKPLTGNPEPKPKDKRPVFVIPQIIEMNEGKLGKRLIGWILNPEDKKMLDEIIKNLEPKK